jgi:hypothetical protein
METALIRDSRPMQVLQSGHVGLSAPNKMLQCGIYRSDYDRSAQSTRYQVSDSLTISATVSVLTMALFVLFGI